MNFDYTPKVQALREKLLAFFDEHIYPNERAFSDEIGRNRANGPTRAFLPTCAPTRCENERMTAPSSTLTFSPNTT